MTLLPKWSTEITGKKNRVEYYLEPVFKKFSQLLIDLFYNFAFLSEPVLKLQQKLYINLWEWLYT